MSWKKIDCSKNFHSNSFDLLKSTTIHWNNHLIPWCYLIHFISAELPNGVTVLWDGLYNVRVRVPWKYKGKIGVSLETDRRVYTLKYSASRVFWVTSMIIQTMISWRQRVLWKSSQTTSVIAGKLRIVVCLT